jgi:DNA-binding response OmpR family regulator
MAHILIVEDDHKIARIIALQLEYAGYVTTHLSNGKEAVAYAKRHDCDLILMDIMMPELNGMEACKLIKSYKPHLGIILLTAKDDLEDIIKGLDNGADDYVTKPFIFDELLARIRANIRKYKILDSLDNDLITFEDLSINETTYEVFRQNQLIELSKTEFDLLRYLVFNQGIVLTRDQILNHVWGHDYEGAPNIVDVYIKYLRDKIDRPYDRTLIQTVRGRGYVIK